MEKDRSGPQIKVLNWGLSNFDGIVQELSKVDWGRLFTGQESSAMWDAFKSEIARVQDQHIPVTVKDKAGRSREAFKSEIVRVQGQNVPVTVKGKAARSRKHLMMRDTEILVNKKKEAYVRYRQLGPSESLEEYRECRSTLKMEIRRAKREHEIALVDKVKENPKRFYKYIKGKRVTRERIGPLKINKVIYV